jgi:3-phenylpropionate/trans-cinnamate dioxygenase ferredoxin component
MGEFVTVGNAGDIGEGEAQPFDANGNEVAVARSGGVLYAFSDICTHRGCNLAMGGEIEGTTITCECHGSIFDIRTGEVVSPPATQPIAVYGVREAEGSIQVEV